MTRRLKEFFEDTSRTRRVLSLDGGGVRGMFTLGVLGGLERELQRRTGDNAFTLSRYFDLIGGTSTGSIIATGLALGMRVAEISAFYKTLCPEIFKEPANLLTAGMFSKFRSGPLTKGLGVAFGENTLASPNLKTGLALHLMRLDRGSAWILVNNPNWIFYGDNAEQEGAESEAAANKRFRLRDLVQASAAAPFYFRGRKLTVATDPTGKKSKEDGYFVDGGVSGNNNPAMEMLMAIRDPAYGFNWPLGPDQLFLLSIGTGSMRGAKPASQYANMPSVEHAKESLSAMIGAVSQQQIAILQAMSQSHRRWIINMEKGAQPKAPYLTPGPMFEYQRIDARIDPDPQTDDRRHEHAVSYLAEPLSRAQLEAMAQIDNKADENLQLLQTLGDAVGTQYFSDQFPRTIFDAGIRA